MKRVKWYLVLLLVGILLFVGGCPEEPPVIPPTIPVTPTGYSDISIPIETFPSQPHIDAVMSTVVRGELTVTLGSNPTSFFRWSENAEISDESVVRQTSHIFIGPGIEKPPGTPGEEVFTFKALKKGTTTILLEYSRPWKEEDVGLWAVFIAVTIE
ncbi:hypothetical protein ES708_26302 [subsurface metagenome]